MKKVLTEPLCEKQDNNEDDGQDGPSSHSHTANITIFSSTHSQAAPCCWLLSALDRRISEAKHEYFFCLYIFRLVVLYSYES